MFWAFKFPNSYVKVFVNFPYPPVFNECLINFNRLTINIVYVELIDMFHVIYVIKCLMYVSFSRFVGYMTVI